MKVSNIIQFILGFLIGIIVLAGGGALIGYYWLSKMGSAPAKPIYSEEKQPEQKPTAKPVSQTKETPKPSPSKSPSPSPSPKKEEKLEPGAYKARVIWSSGLSLRDGPSRDSSRIGGLDYNTELIVIQESDDKEWQKVRIPDTGQEGWVKAGNTEKVEE